MDEGQIEVRVDKLENLPITGRFGLRLKNIADGKDDKALASCTIKEGRSSSRKGHLPNGNVSTIRTSGFASSNVSRSY